MEVKGYSHAVVIKEGFEDKIVDICNGWIEAHNYIQKNRKPGMRIVGIKNVKAEIKELRDREAEEDGKES